MSDPVMLAQATDGQRDALRATLLAALRLPVYAGSFGRSGVNAAAIRADPLRSLAHVPIFDPAMHAELARQTLVERRFDLGGVELSSGTAGAPKRRILSEEDVLLDAAHVTRLLGLAGVRADDRVAAVELSATPLALAFLEGCERLGVRDCTAVAWRPGADAAPLRRLAPTVVIGPPSLIEHLAPSLSGVRLIIYNGDRLGSAVAAELQRRGIGVRSLYGLTETSALGVGCAAEHGVHLAPEHALFEVRPLATDHELLVTTLGFSMPLLRYPTGDRARILPGLCPCGLSWPRMEILGRLGGRFSLFEIETSVEELHTLLLGGSDAPLQVELTDAAGGRVRMTLTLPPETRASWRAMRTRLRSHPLLEFPITTGLVQVRFRTQGVGATRKAPLLVDRRGEGERADAG